MTPNQDTLLVVLVVSKEDGFTDPDRTRPNCGQHVVDVLGWSA